MKTNKIVSENTPMQIVANPSYYGTIQKQWVMNAQGPELEAMLLDFLTELDEYQQIAGDNDDEQMVQEFANDYNTIEAYYIKVKNKNNLSFNERNDIRSIMKFDVKQVIQYLC